MFPGTLSINNVISFHHCVMNASIALSNDLDYTLVWIAIFVYVHFSCVITTEDALRKVAFFFAGVEYWKNKSIGENRTS